jgi:peroxiredoxin
MPLKVGQTAPDFELPAVTGESQHRFRLGEHAGKRNLVLAFYPLDWTPV